MCRYATESALEDALASDDRELPLPQGESIVDGEWLLAIVEVESTGKVTAAAARGVLHDGDVLLCFEPRDWGKLRTLAGHPDDGPHSASGRTEWAADEAPPTDASPRIAPRRPSLPSASFIGKFGEPPGARVLLVDDDPDLRDVVSAMLETVGFTVCSVANGEEALARIEVESFDMVVLDWTLPGMSGIELCRTIRQRTSSASLPLLFLTANASSRDMVDAFACGADDYVVKPFRAPELGARIFGLLRRARLTTGA